MLPNRALFSALVVALLSPLAEAQEPLRIQSLQRCGDVQWKTATFFRGAHCLPVTWS